MGKRRDGLTIVIGSAPLPGLGGCRTVSVPDYELTDDQIVTCFKLDPLESASTFPAAIGANLAALRELVAKDGQQVGLARWVNGIECVLFFDQDRQCPRPEQLLRAYKNAFATRALMSNATASSRGPA